MCLAARDAANQAANQPIPNFGLAVTTDLTPRGPDEPSTPMTPFLTRRPSDAITTIRT